MKNFFQSILWCCLPWALSAQLYSDGGTLQIDANAVLFVDGDVTNSNNAELTNNGAMTAANLTNDANMQGNGEYNIFGDWTNNGGFSGPSTVQFIGSGNSTVQSGGGAFHLLRIQKDNANLVLSDDASVESYMGFLQPNNKVILAGNKFLLSSNIIMEGHGPTSYFVTGDDGTLMRAPMGTTQLVFPVGFDETSYNPLYVSQNGTADVLGVRCLEHHYVSGNSGAHITTDVVDASWEISEAEPGGNNLHISAFWNAVDELDFEPNNCAIGYGDMGGWDYGSQPGGQALIDNGMFYRTRAGVDELGIFGVRSGMALTDARETEAALPNLGLFPNPATDLLSIDFDVRGDYLLRVFDESGRFVLTVENAKTLDVSRLPEGVYALLATSKEGETYQKFIVGR